MDTGNINAATTGTYALMMDTLRAGRGGYGGEGAYGGQFAGPSANAVRINRNMDITRLGIDRISDQNEENRRGQSEARVMDNITDGHNRICESVHTAEVANRDMIFQQELRNSDRLAALQAEMNANARQADKCCCDIQLNQCKDTAAIMARMEALSKESVSRDLDRAERELIALKTQVACGCTTGCSTPCGG